ncbi:hypothetical protein LCGC14_2218910 [marine sediment metagenome]|uniref:Uncharacterized protein n=1 Tax=marine sediment metagenome TaxID=412755 RepID=A0A0F9G749_9ZZZZ
MPRKYINRERKRSNKVSADDEWAHITGIEKGPELEIEDAMDVQERTIALTNEQANKTRHRSAGQNYKDGAFQVLERKTQTRNITPRRIY